MGEGWLSARSPTLRRPQGATYTPAAIVDAMINAAAAVAPPARIVDPGAGSGRFLIAAARRFPDAQLVAIEADPSAALILSANLAVLGLTHRAEIRVEDYRTTAPLTPIAGPTLFLGNPPYVRHHQIAPAAKDWYRAATAAQGIRASALAGLHLHFFVRTLELAQPGDRGLFITAAEWLDVGYGAGLRRLLLGPLGLTGLHVLDPRIRPFADATTTAAVTGFTIGARPPAIRVRSVDTLADLPDWQSGTLVPREALATNLRWSTLLRPSAPALTGTIRLGDLFRVSRGQATGLNRVWIAGPASADLAPALLVPTVTKARELIMAGGSLCDPRHLRRVVDLPADLDRLDPADRPAVERFLAWARAQGAAEGYLARHRPAWWAVRLLPPAPILCTYMARRPPVFVRNLCGARHLNIAHGLYPRTTLPTAVIDRLLAWLAATVTQAEGRTYAGGLTKFEPGDLERLAIPDPDRLDQVTPLPLTDPPAA